MADKKHSARFGIFRKQMEQARRTPVSAILNSLPDPLVLEAGSDNVPKKPELVLLGLMADPCFQDAVVLPWIKVREDELRRDVPGMAYALGLPPESLDDDDLIKLMRKYALSSEFIPDMIEVINRALSLPQSVV